MTFTTRRPGIDHLAEADLAARHGRYEIAQYHATMAAVEATDRQTEQIRVANLLAYTADCRPNAEIETAIIEGIL